jgi:hypothetical protein
MSPFMPVAVKAVGRLVGHAHYISLKGRTTHRGSNMLDWLTWPADQLLRIGGVVAGWFFSRDATSFTVVQMMFATLVLAAFVTLIVCWQNLVECWRSYWKPR